MSLTSFMKLHLKTSLNQSLTLKKRIASTKSSFMDALKSDLIIRRELKSRSTLTWVVGIAETKRATMATSSL